MLKETNLEWLTKVHRDLANEPFVCLDLNFDPFFLNDGFILTTCYPSDHKYTLEIIELVKDLIEKTKSFEDSVVINTYRNVSRRSLTGIWEHTSSYSDCLLFQKFREKKLDLISKDAWRKVIEFNNWLLARRKYYNPEYPWMIYILYKLEKCCNNYRDQYCLRSTKAQMKGLVVPLLSIFTNSIVTSSVTNSVYLDYHINLSNTRISIKKPSDLKGVDYKDLIQRASFYLFQIDNTSIKQNLVTSGPFKTLSTNLSVNSLRDANIFGEDQSRNLIFPKRVIISLNRIVKGFVRKSTYDYQFTMFLLNFLVYNKEYYNLVRSDFEKALNFWKREDEAFLTSSGDMGDIFLQLEKLNSSVEDFLKN